MDIYRFRKAHPDEKQAVTDFMNRNWGDKHPLVNDERLYSYYFCRNGEFNFALCLAGDSIAAVAGYIYSNNDKTAAYVSIWCADKSYNGAGLELMEQLKSIAEVQTLCCNNIRPNTLRFYEFLGYSTGMFKHAYMISQRADYKIASIVNPVFNPPLANDATLTEIQDISNLPLDTMNKSLLIKKDLAYLNFRYIEYPFRKYRFFRLESGSEVALFVLRLTEVDGSYAIRVVDYIGRPELIASSGEQLYALLEIFNAEYLDFYCAGIDDNILIDAGFNIRDDADKNIIPNYTEPLNKINIDFYYFTSETNSFTMFRADGDGDRPILC